MFCRMSTDDALHCCPMFRYHSALSRCATACGAEESIFSCLPGNCRPQLQIVTSPGGDWERHPNRFVGQIQGSSDPVTRSAHSRQKRARNGARDRAFVYGRRDDDSFLIVSTLLKSQPDTRAHRPGVFFFHRAGASRYVSPDEFLHFRLRRSFRMTVCCAAILRGAASSRGPAQEQSVVGSQQSASSDDASRELPKPFFKPNSLFCLDK